MQHPPQASLVLPCPPPVIPRASLVLLHLPFPLAGAHQYCPRRVTPPRWFNRQRRSHVSLVPSKPRRTSSTISSSRVRECFLEHRFGVERRVFVGGLTTGIPLLLRNTDFVGPKIRSPILVWLSPVHGFRCAQLLYVDSFQRPNFVSLDFNEQQSDERQFSECNRVSFRLCFDFYDARRRLGVRLGFGFNLSIRVILNLWSAVGI